MLQISKSTLRSHTFCGFTCMTVVCNVGFRLCVGYVNPSRNMSLHIVASLIHIQELALSLSRSLFFSYFFVYELTTYSNTIFLHKAFFKFYISV
jgi:hypothetical protein